MLHLDRRLAYAQIQTGGTVLSLGKISGSRYYGPMDHKIVEDYIQSMPAVSCGYPFGTDVAVYKVATEPTDGLVAAEPKMFALISEGSSPLRLSLKCDPQLAVLLRDTYETVMAGYHLNKKHWNTLVLTGQVPWEQVQDLIRHSYLLVTGDETLPKYLPPKSGRPKAARSKKPTR